MSRFWNRRRGDDSAREGGADAGALVQAFGRLGDGLRVQVTAEGIALIGEVDLATREALRQALDLLDEATFASRVVVDLSRLTFIDGRGAGLLADAARSLGPAKTLVLRAPGQSVRTVIEALRLDAVENVVIEPGPAGL